MPTTQNVDRIIKDFSDGTQQYAAAHLFFVEGMRTTPLWLQRIDLCYYLALDEQLFQRLTSSPAEPFLQALKELFINFWGTLTLYMDQHLNMNTIISNGSPSLYSSGTWAIL